MLVIHSNLFKVGEQDKSLKEDESLKIVLGTEDEINAYEFDQSFENIFILENEKVLEKKSLGALDEVTMSIKLKEKVQDSGYKLLSLSHDGSLCVIGGGFAAYFYLLDLDSKAQHKLSSEALTQTNAPCFINGDNEQVGVVGKSGQGVEIWDVRSKKPVQVLQVDGEIGCMTSTHNILAVGTSPDILQLWDVRNWELFYEEKFNETDPTSLHLTADLKYLTLGGMGGDGCVVLQIK